MRQRILTTPCPLQPPVLCYLHHGWRTRPSTPTNLPQATALSCHTTPDPLHTTLEPSTLSISSAPLLPLVRLRGRGGWGGRGARGCKGQAARRAPRHTPAALAAMARHRQALASGLGAGVLLAPRPCDCGRCGRRSPGAASRDRGWRCGGAASGAARQLQPRAALPRRPHWRPHAVHQLGSARPAREFSLRVSSRSPIAAAGLGGSWGLGAPAGFGGCSWLMVVWRGS